MPPVGPPASADPADHGSGGVRAFHLGHRPALDGLRGLAITIVVLYHVGSYLWVPTATLFVHRGPVWTLRGGFLGVDLFFALSGFLITVLLLGEADRRGSVSLRNFGARRLRRLWPVLVALLVALLALSLAGWLHTTEEVRDTVLPVLSFTQNWAVAEGRAPVVGYLWSIGVEGQFYLVWAAVVVMALRTRRPHAVLAATAIAAIVAVLAWRAHLYGDGASVLSLYVRTSTRLDAPLVGALAGVVASAGWLPRFAGRVATAAGAVGLVLVVGAATLLRFTDAALYRGLFTVVAAGAALGVLAVVRSGGGPLVGLLSFRPLIAVGIVSYSLYVWHLLVFEIVLRHTAAWPAAPRAALGVGVASGVAVLSYRFVERPFLRRRSASRGQAATPNAKQRSSSSPKAYSS